MELQHIYFVRTLLAVLVVLIAVNGFSIPVTSTTKTQNQQGPHSENESLVNGIVLIRLDDAAKDLSGYGILPVVLKDLMSPFDANGTLSRNTSDLKKFNFYDKNQKEPETKDEIGAAQSSRLLPLATAPKKALLLFALHETFLKSRIAQQSNCVAISNDDLATLLNNTMVMTPMGN